MNEELEKALQKLFRNLGSDVYDPIGHHSAQEAAQAIRDLFAQLEDERDEAKDLSLELTDEIANSWVPKHRHTRELLKSIVLIINPKSLSADAIANQFMAELDPPPPSRSTT